MNFRLFDFRIFEFPRGVVANGGGRKELRKECRKVGRRKGADARSDGWAGKFRVYRVESVNPPTDSPSPPSALRSIRTSFLSPSIPSIHTSSVRPSFIHSFLPLCLYLLRSSEIRKPGWGRRGDGGTAGRKDGWEEGANKGDGGPTSGFAKPPHPHPLIISPRCSPFPPSCIPPVIPPSPLPS